MNELQLAGLIRTGVIPAGVTLVVLLAMWRPWRKEHLTPRWPVSVALAAGFIAAHFAIRGWQGSHELGTLAREIFVGERPWWAVLREFWVGVWRGLWPADSGGRLPAFVAFGLMSAWATGKLDASDTPRALAARILFRFATLIAVGFFLLEPLLRNTWGLGDGFVVVLVFAMVGSAWWGLIASVATRRPDALLPATLAVIALGGAPVMYLWGVASYAQLSAGFAVVLGVVAVAAWRRPDLVDNRAIGAAPTIGLVTLWAAGLFFGTSATSGAAWVLALSPVLCLIAMAPLLRDLREWQSGAVQIGVAVCVLGVGAMLARSSVGGDDSGGSDSAGAWDSMGALEEPVSAEEGEESEIDGRWLWDDE